MYKLLKSVGKTVFSAFCCWTNKRACQFYAVLALEVLEWAWQKVACKSIEIYKTNHIMITNKHFSKMWQFCAVLSVRVGEAKNCLANQ